ncbi:glycosyltransferase family 2 protein, partial [Verrucomicrobiota bacterium]
MIPCAVVLLAAGLLAYAWLGYPVLLAVAAKSRPRRTAGGATGASERTVCILFSAHNEEGHIAERLGNLLGQEYPSERVTIRVGIDGSSDRTASIAREFARKHPNIRVHEVSERRGKIAMLKDLVARSTEDVLVFTDANTEFEPRAVATLVSHFADPGLGGVCGRLVFAPSINGNAAGAGTSIHGSPDASSSERSYWLWETGLKEMESRANSCLGANGAIYAIRRELFWKDIPDNTIIDDFVIGMKVREQGMLMVYEPDAVAHEALPAKIEHEWRRRVRIGAGDYQALAFCRRCLLPRYGRFSWMFWSHKVLRWFTPHLTLLMVAG